MQRNTMAEQQPTVCPVQAFESLCIYNTAVLHQRQAGAHPTSHRQLIGTVPPPNEALTDFQSATLPPLSLVELAACLERNLRCFPVALRLAIVLAVTYCEQSQEAPTMHRMHRLLVVCLQVVSKAHSDFYYDNAVAAPLSGIPAGEMNFLELKVLQTCDWSVPMRRAKLHPTALAKRMDGLRLHTSAAVPTPPPEGLEAIRAVGARLRGMESCTSCQSDSSEAMFPTDTAASPVTSDTRFDDHLVVSS